MEENPKLKENCTGGLGMAELLQEAVKEAQESVVTTDKGTEILDRVGRFVSSLTPRPTSWLALLALKSLSS